MILNLFFYNPQEDYRFSWRHPDAPGADIFTSNYYASLAREVEAAALDAIFVADHIAVWDTVPSGLTHYANVRFEPLTLLSALTVVMEHIGLMATASTSYDGPYNLARYFASLGFLSNGRANWNVVTSWLGEEAAGFSLEQFLLHGARYRRANEFIDMVTRLWDPWEDGATIFDKTHGLFADAGKVHHLGCQGEYFRMHGPFNVPRPPQGHPLLVQTDSSKAGKTLAAVWSDMHFVLIRSIAEGLAHREETNQRLRQHGRDPAHFKIVAGVLPVMVGSNEGKAARQQLDEQLTNDQMTIDLLSSYLRVGLSALPRDQPLPPLPDEENFDGIHTALKLIRQYDPRLALLELGELLLQSFGSRLLLGNAGGIAAALTETQQAGIADGFNLIFPLLPGDFDRFIDQVVPILQRNGVVHDRYPPGILRGKLGLPTVENCFTAPQPDVARPGTDRWPGHFTYS